MGSSSQVDDSITRKYDIKRRIGKGAYGIVWKGIDRSTNRPVAVKKIFDAFCNATDAQRTFREIMFLQEFRNHPNVVKLLNIHRAGNDKDIYLVFEYMETDLHKVIKRKHILQDLHKRFIMYQLLRATYYIHSGNVIHRDQKPSNILLDSYCRCKMADFGLARSLSGDGVDGVSSTDPALTDYVATRWYRAPEILVASKQYTKGIDMWSLGCILAEMLLGKPLFPGSSTINQVEWIMATIDPPTPADLACVCPGYGSSLFTRAPAGPRLPLTELLRGAPIEGVDLVCRLLVLNPFKRLTAEQALEHPYVARFRRQGREPAMQRCVVPALRDDVQLSVGEYRSKLYEMYDRTSPTPATGSTRSPTPSSSSSSSPGDRGKQTRAANKLVSKPSKGNMAAQGGGDSGVTLRPAVSKTSKLNGAPQSKSGGSGSSTGSVPLSTPPLRKPTRPPSDADPKRRQTRHLSTEDVRSRYAARPALQRVEPRAELRVEHLLPRRLSASDSAVSAPQGRSPPHGSTAIRRHHHRHHHRHHSDAALANPVAARRSCHAQLDRVGDMTPVAVLRAGGVAGGGHRAARTKPPRTRPAVDTSHAHPQLGAAGGLLRQVRVALGAAPQSVPQPVAPRSSGSLSNVQPLSRDSTHSLGFSLGGGGRVKEHLHKEHHAYFSFKRQPAPAPAPAPGSAGSLLGSQTVGNIGFISASGLSELRPAYRWQR